MAKNHGILVCLLIIALDVVAGILGIEADMAQNKVNQLWIECLQLLVADHFIWILICWWQVKHLKMWVFECRDPSYQAFKLGLAAILFLPLAHIIANLLGGCTCMWSKEDFGKASATRKLAVASLFLSWYLLSKQHCKQKLDSIWHAYIAVLGKSGSYWPLGSQCWS